MSYIFQEDGEGYWRVGSWVGEDWLEVAKFPPEEGAQVEGYVSYLNGGLNPDLVKAIREVLALLPRFLSIVSSE